MSKPRALDLLCGAGGVSVGLERAGFEVTGVDINPQPRHKGGRFIQADALTFDLSGYDFIWASPPCPGYKHGAVSGKHPRLIAAIRERIQTEAPGVPYIIENVMDAAPHMRNPAMLCGTMFDGLKVYRHRLFESNVPLAAPPHQAHEQRFPRAGRGANEDGWICVCGNMKDPGAGRRAMGIEWMNRYELAQAIPPTYAQYLACQVLNYL